MTDQLPRLLALRARVRWGARGAEPRSSRVSRARDPRPSRPPLSRPLPPPSSLAGRRAQRGNPGGRPPSGGGRAGLAMPGARGPVPTSWLPWLRAGDSHGRDAVAAGCRPATAPRLSAAGHPHGPATGCGPTSHTSHGASTTAQLCHAFAHTSHLPSARDERDPRCCCPLLATVRERARPPRRRTLRADGGGCCIGGGSQAGRGRSSTRWLRPLAAGAPRSALPIEVRQLLFAFLRGRATGHGTSIDPAVATSGRRPHRRSEPAAVCRSSYCVCVSSCRCVLESGPPPAVLAGGGGPPLSMFSETPRSGICA